MFTCIVLGVYLAVTLALIVNTHITNSTSWWWNRKSYL